MRAGHHGVRARRQGMRRQPRPEPEMRGPRRVDQQRHPGLVRGRRVPGQVAGGADVRRVTEEHRAGVRMPGQRVPDRPDRDRAGQPGRGVHLGQHPYRLQPGQHDAEQQRAVQRPGDHDRPARFADGQGERLVAVRRAGHREPAPVGAPQLCGPPLPLGQQLVRVLDAVQPAVQRRVTRGHRAGEVTPLLVPGHAHRGQGPGVRLRGEPQPGVQQRRVGGQPPGVPGVGHRAPAAGCCGSCR